MFNCEQKFLLRNNFCTTQAALDGTNLLYGDHVLADIITVANIILIKKRFMISDTLLGYEIPLKKALT